MDVTVHGSPFTVRHLGLVDYQAGLDLQNELVDQRKQGLIPDQLLLLEHPPVITLGARNHNSRSNVLETPESLAHKGVALFETGRGGDVTYHGPGQLVGYPILELQAGRRDVHRYVRDLEEVLIQAVSDFGIAATRIPGLTGIWVGEEKLAAIGVRLSRWVTGITGKGVTSMERLAARPVPMAEVARAVVRRFESVFTASATISK